jgi:hypothetical protein
MTPRPVSPGIAVPAPNSTKTDLLIFARDNNIAIPSSVTKKADIRAFIESRMGMGAPMSAPPPPEFSPSINVEGAFEPGSESGIGTASGKGLKLKGRPRKEISDVMAGKDVEKHFKKFKALMKKESAGSLTPIQSKRLDSYKQLHAGGFFSALGNVAKKGLQAGLKYAMENPDKIFKFATEYGPVAIDFLKDKNVFDF